MTVLVGVRCRDGVVIGADTAVTYGPGAQFGQNTLEVPQGFKITLLMEQQIIVATTGEVGLGQRFCNVVGKKWVDLKAVNTKANPVEVMADLSNRARNDFEATRAPWERSWGLGGLLGMTIGGEARLIFFDHGTLRPELVGEREGDRFKSLPIITTGGGQPQADPFLAHAYRAMFGDTHFPTVSEGRLLVAWTLEHVIRTNVGGVGGELDIAVLEKGPDGQFRATMWDAGEAHGAVLEIEKYIREFPKRWLEQKPGAKGIEEQIDSAKAAG